jgi:hypothetical protein
VFAQLSAKLLPGCPNRLDCDWSCLALPDQVRLATNRNQDLAMVGGRCEAEVSVVMLAWFWLRR